jgi:hypothetical protein
VWAALNLGYVLIAIQIMHRRLIPSEKWRWYREDVGRPLLVSVGTAGAFRALLPVPTDMLFLSAYFAMIVGVTLLLTALTTPVTRNSIYVKFPALREFCATRT